MRMQHPYQGIQAVAVQKTAIPAIKVQVESVNRFSRQKASLSCNDFGQGAE
jgi:hypothetical protein